MVALEKPLTGYRIFEPVRKCKERTFRRNLLLADPWKLSVQKSLLCQARTRRLERAGCARNGGHAGPCGAAERHRPQERSEHGCPAGGARVARAPAGTCGNHTVGAARSAGRMSPHRGRLLGEGVPGQVQA